MMHPPNLEEIEDSREEIELSGFFDRIEITFRLRIETFIAGEYVAMMAERMPQ